MCSIPTIQCLTNTLWSSLRPAPSGSSYRRWQLHISKLISCSAALQIAPGAWTTTADGDALMAVIAVWLEQTKVRLNLRSPRLTMQPIFIPAVSNKSLLWKLESVLWSCLRQDVRPGGGRTPEWDIPLPIYFLRLQWLCRKIASRRLGERLISKNYFIKRLFVFQSKHDSQKKGFNPVGRPTYDPFKAYDPFEKGS